MRSFLLFAALAVSAFASLHVAHGQTPNAIAPADADRDAHFARNADRMEALSTGRSDASENFDATYYDLQLGIDFDVRRITGITRVVGQVVGQPLQTLRLDLARTMEVAAIRDATDAGLYFTHEDDVLMIELPEEFGIGEQIDLHIEYAGEPAQLGFGSFTFGQVVAGPVAWTLSEPYGAREWWPGKDHPSDKADSVRVTVTVPEGLRVGSNGLLVAETTADGRSTFEWMHRYPIAPYLVSIAAGPYEVFEQTYQRPDSLAAQLGELSLPILHYQYRRDGGTTLYGNWAEVADMLAVYEYWFGPYPFASEKYGHAEFTWGGGMEHQTMSSMGGTSIMLVAHEVAHQWYGNLVTLHTWPHLWLNEGFASYAELLYWEAMEERYRQQFRIELESDMSRARIAPGTLVVQDTLNINNLFNATRVYAKGSVVLHMLRRMVGDEAFREILQAYASDPDVRYGTAVTSDFHRIAEEVSGRDLDAFFHQWVTVGYGHPNYEVSWQHEGTEHTAILLTVAQTQTAPESNIQVFEMPITILVETESGDERFVVENDARVQQYRLELDSRPERVVFDPDMDLLRNADVTVSDAPDLPDLETSLMSIYPNPAAGSATIQYALDEAASPGIAIFDALGREVMRLDVAVRSPGIHKEALDLKGLAAGAYLVRLDIGAESFTRSIVVSGTPR